MGDVTKIGWSRASRTDKGVHSLASVRPISHRRCPEPRHLTMPAAHLQCSFASIDRVGNFVLLLQVVALKMQCPDDGAPFLEDPEGLGLAADINKYLPETVRKPRQLPSGQWCRHRCSASAARSTDQPLDARTICMGSPSHCSSAHQLMSPPPPPPIPQIQVHCVQRVVKSFR